MSFCGKLAVIGVVAAFCLAAIEVEAAVVVETGFNDAVGISPSDYTAGGSLIGKGVGEPGWTGNWAGSFPAHFNTTPTPKTEGDLALTINTTTGSSTVTAVRYFTPQSDVFYVDTMVQASSALNSHGLIMYIREGGSVASMMSLGPGIGSGAVRVSDQTTNGNYEWANTGYSWTAGEWIRFTQEIDVPNKTYRVWIDGKPFDPAPADPLNFRHDAVTAVNNVNLFLPEQSASTRTIHVDQFQVLTHRPPCEMAATGFEPEAGYVDGETVIGKADGEGGWTDTWQIMSSRDNGTAIVQSAVKHSGEQALKMTSVGSPDMMIQRHYGVQNQLFSLEFDVLIDGPLNNGLHLYAGNSAGTGFNMSFETDYDISARDGDGAGGGALEDTGFNWSVDQWTHVTARIDPESQTYELLIDGVKYNSPDPLGFRNRPTYIDDFCILLLQQGANGPGVYFDNIMINVPEPGSLALLIPAAFGLLLPMRRRRGK